MIALLRRGSSLLLAAVVVWGLSATPGEACPICSAGGRTLTQEVKQADMVLFGTLAKGDLDRGTTDLAVEAALKDHKLRRGRKVIELRSYFPSEPDGAKRKYLIFFCMDDNKLGPFCKRPVEAGSKLPKYLEGALARGARPPAERLRYFFDYLDSADADVAEDAHKEFDNTDYNDFKVAARALPADRVARWLRAPNTPATRLGLYALMLGHCGKEKDAIVLKNLLAGPDRCADSGMAGALAGYVMLKKKEGWEHTKNVLADSKQNFAVRYAALRAVRFLHEHRRDLVSKQEAGEAASLLLNQDDIADLAIDDLRKWQCWDRANVVLAVRETAFYKNTPIVQQAVLGYCLQCPKSPAAQAYVAERRQADREAVEETEELLKGLPPSVR
jgi:hypothetical protein